MGKIFLPKKKIFFFPQEEGGGGGGGEWVHRAHGSHVPPWVPWVPKGALYGVKGVVLYHRTLFRHDWASYSSYGALDWRNRNYNLLSIISQRFSVTLDDFYMGFTGFYIVLLVFYMVLPVF